MRFCTIFCTGSYHGMTLLFRSYGVYCHDEKRTGVLTKSNIDFFDLVCYALGTNFASHCIGHSWALLKW